MQPGVRRTGQYETPLTMPRQSAKKTATPPSRSRTPRRCGADPGGPTPADLQADDAVLARVARYVGEDAREPVQTYVDLGFLQTLYRKGNPKALLYCVILCAQQKARVPPWALSALAEAFRRHVREDKKLEPLLYRCERGGRTANPAEYALQRRIELQVRHAVEAARFGGDRGDKAYEQARQHLADAGYAYTVKSIKRLYYTAKRRPVGWDEFQCDIEERIGLPARKFGWLKET